MIGLDCRFYQASQLGDVRRDAAAAEREHAVLPALARTARRRSTRYWMTRNYREAYGMFAVNGILFNHESPAPRRDVRDPQDHAGGGPDQGRPAGRRCTSATSTPCATGATPRSTSRRCGGCCSTTSRTTTSSPRAPPTPCATSSSSRSSTSASTGEQYVRFDERYLRPTEVDALIGDAVARQRELLGWTPTRSHARAGPAHGRRGYRGA